MRIYLITNTVNDKAYVGQTIRSLNLRWKRHCWMCTRNSGMPISKAIAKYGADSFTMTELEACSSQEELDARELYWAKTLNTFSPNGYNLKAGAGKGAMSQETKDKIGRAHLGRVVSAQARENMSKAHLGVPLSDALVAKMRERHKGRQVAKPTAKCVGTYKLTRADGVTFMVTDMKKFCTENGYCRSKMSNLVRGHIATYLGWRGEKLGKALVAIG